MLVLPYRFRAGDSRNDRPTFVRWAIERLEAWDGLAPAKDGTEPPETALPQKRLAWMLERVVEKRQVLFVLDGLDEIAERDRTFVPDVVRGLPGRRVAWVCAGRPERGLAELFGDAQQPFPEGLPRMSEQDVRRALLLVRLSRGRARDRLLSRDEERGGRVHNAFLERLAERSEGMPVYLNHALGDLQSGRLTPDQEAQLPKGLAEYHERLLERCAVGDLQATVTPLVVLLALSEEPLGVPACAALLVRLSVHPTPEHALVEQALGAVQGMLRRGPEPDGDVGYTLFHHSLRQHILGAARVRATVSRVSQGLGEAARDPAGDAAEAYLYRCGIRHRLANDDRGGALRQLCDFAYVMARLKRVARGSAAVEGLYTDWSIVANAELDGAGRAWWDFLRTKRHFLRRADGEWGAEKILLQLATELADDSPVTQAADGWLKEGLCDWVWLRAARQTGSGPRPIRALRSSKATPGRSWT